MTTKRTVPHSTSMSDDQALRMLQMERHRINLLFADMGHVHLQRRDRYNDPYGRCFTVHVPFDILRIFDRQTGNDIDLLADAAKKLVCDRLPNAVIFGYSVRPRVGFIDLEFSPSPRLPDLRSADLFLEYNTGRTNRDAWTITRSPLEHLQALIDKAHAGLLWEESVLINMTMRFSFKRVAAMMTASLYLAEDREPVNVFDVLAGHGVL